MERKWIVFPAVAVTSLVLDQVTKVWIQTWDAVNPPPNRYTVIPHFFDLVHAENPGAAFGMLGGLPMQWRMLIFIGFAAIATVVILDLWRKLPGNDWLMSTAMALIMSGAIGNAIDRVYKGTVTDFLRFYTDDPEWVAWLRSTIGMSEYPSFNVADIALFVGVGVYIVYYLFFEEPEQAAAEASEPAEEPGTDEQATGEG